ncbi:MAG: stage III sporulation protein AC [Clostridia bacterium]|nr:stage III sporulation protein AC [Clostridia bacterium]
MNIDIIFKIAGIGILITVIVQILKKSDRDEIATLVSIAGLVIVLTFVINMVSELFDSIRTIFNLF